MLFKYNFIFVLNAGKWISNTNSILVFNILTEKFKFKDKK